MADTGFSFRISPSGGDTVKAELQTIGREGRKALKDLEAAALAASSGLGETDGSAERVVAQLQALANRSAQVAAQLQSSNGVYRTLAQNIDEVNRVSAGVARSQSDFDAYGRALDGVRAKFNPVFAVHQRYRATLDEIRDAHRVGAISADEMAAAISRERRAALDSIGALKGRARAIDAFAVSGGNAAFRMQQVGYQLNDIGVQLASGSNPFTILAQQGTQIAQVYAGQGGVSTALKDVGIAARAVVTRFGPIAAVAAAGAAAIAGLTHEINETAGASVTFGDTFKAVFSLIGEQIYGFIRPAVEAISGFFADAWDVAVEATVFAGNSIVQGVQITVFAMKAIWDGGLTAIAKLAAVFPEQLSANWDRILGYWYQTVGLMAQKFGEFLSFVSGGLAEIPGFDGGSGFLAGQAADLIAFGVSNLDRAGRAFASADAGDAAAQKLRADAASALSDAYDEVLRKGAEIAASDPLGDIFDAIAARAREIAAARKAAEDAEKKTGKARSETRKEERDRAAELIAALEREIAVMRESDPIKRKMIEYSAQLAEATDTQRQEVERLLIALAEEADGFAAIGRSLRDYGEEASRTGAEIGDALTNAFSRAEDAIVKFTTTGKISFKSLASAIIEDLVRISVRTNVTGPLSSFLGSALSSAFGGGFSTSGGGGFTPLPSFGFSPAPFPSAKGNVFGPGGLAAFAQGGVVNGPTLFGYRGGTGLMGEAGPEAILPLSRGRDGKLGVAAAAGQTVVIHVDARGAGDPARVRQESERGARDALAAYERDRARRGRP